MRLSIYITIAQFANNAENMEKQPSSVDAIHR
jgi:hypothetical protein